MSLLRRTPHKDIVRVRLERVKSVLAELNLSIEKIVYLAGVEYVEYLSASSARSAACGPATTVRSTGGRVAKTINTNARLLIDRQSFRMLG